MTSRLINVQVLLAPIWAGLPVAAVQAQDDAALAEFARKAQDPLGDVKALMTDNTIAFDGGPNQDTSYGFQLQPVYAVDNETSWNIILRGIVPVAGLEPGVVVPPIGPEPRPPNIKKSVTSLLGQPTLTPMRLPSGTWAR